MDLKVGVAFSRFQTLFFKGKYGDLDARLVSYGPCQTPTLGFCVDRHDQIVSFEPEDWWALDLSVRHRESALTVELEWGRSRLFDEEVVRMLESIVREGTNVAGQEVGQVRVESVVEKEGRRGRPLPMNTVEMLKSASKVLIQ